MRVQRHKSLKRRRGSFFPGYMLIEECRLYPKKDNSCKEKEKRSTVYISTMIVSNLNNRNDYNRTVSPHRQPTERTRRPRCGPKSTRASSPRPFLEQTWPSCWSRLCHGEPREHTAIWFRDNAAGGWAGASGELLRACRAGYRLG